MELLNPHDHRIRYLYDRRFRLSRVQQFESIRTLNDQNIDFPFVCGTQCICHRVDYHKDKGLVVTICLVGSDLETYCIRTFQYPKPVLTCAIYFPKSFPNANQIAAGFWSKAV